MKYLSLVALLFTIALPAEAATIPASALAPGDLIRGSSFSAVYYYGKDGMRYVFPNDKTYFTWYTNFNGVKWLSDADLSTIQIGGNVTYKPGVKMLKINSDPKVYALARGGELRAVASEDIAKSLYGNNWNKMIDDVSDGFFSNYHIGSVIDLPSRYDAAAEKRDATDINIDKSLKPFLNIVIKNNGYDPATATIEDGTAVRFVNGGSENESATEWDSKWGTGTLKPGEHFTRYFRKEDEGRWSYYSKFTDKTLMQGSVIVQ